MRFSPAVVPLSPSAQLQHGMDPMTTRKAIDVLVKQERLTYQAQRRQIVRKR